MTDFTKEAVAYQALARLLESAQDCKRMFEEAGVGSLPNPLMRLLGEEGVLTLSPPALRARMTIPPPPRPSAPEGVAHEWIWVPVADLKATNLVLAILRGAGRPTPAREVIEGVQRLRPDISKGTIANIGTRLGDTTIVRSDDGWCLAQGRLAPILHGEYAWGPVEFFEPHEIAAHRRLAILHILHSQPDGLQIMQITKTLQESCPWLPREIPRTKDLVKMDMDALDVSGVAKRVVGHSGKWRALK